MGYARTTPKVMESLNRHRGLDVPIKTVMDETGYTDRQVRSAVRSLIERDKMPITVVMKGQIWRYEASNTSKVEVQELPTDTIFEYVGKTATGDLIVRGDATQTMYRLSSL